MLNLEKEKLSLSQLESTLEKVMDPGCVKD